MTGLSVDPGSVEPMTGAPGAFQFDPITFELIKNAVGSIADEMALTIVRTSRSGVLKDNMDFSTGLCLADGQLLAQGLTLPLHLGSIPDAIAAVLRRYPAATMRPGDIFMLNDPFDGGMHLPDVFIFRPIFASETPGPGDGGAAAPRLAAFAVAIAHQTDVGGRVPGSNASDSTEVYAEGLRIPVVKCHEAGQPNETLFRLIAANVRVPDKVLGDLQAQLAACAMADREIVNLIARYGLTTVERYWAELLDYTERLARAEIAAWPDGVYSFTDYIDGDGIEERTIPICVRIEIAGDTLHVDFAGTSPQVKGAINATLSFARSAVYLAVRSIMESAIPNNAGYFRPITVSAPPASIVNPVLPAATAARGLTGFRVVDTMFGALARVRPDRVPAACEGGNTGVSIGGYDAERRPFIFVEFVCGAGGARPRLDGIDGHTNPAVCMANVPCEVVEVESPVVIEEYGFAPDSGGAGEHRGGLALVRQYRFVEDEAILQVRSDRREHRPWGLAGGGSGAPSMNVLNPDGEARPLPSKFTMTIRRGDTLRHTQPGGGGYGDPRQRDPAAVREDVLDERISLDHARSVYGVVLDPVTLTIDVEATAARRRQLVKIARPRTGSAPPPSETGNR